MDQMYWSVSVAEDFHTNDYPEEPVYDSEDDLPRRFNPSDDDTDDDPNVFKPWVRGGQRFGDEEFDLDDDDDDEGEEGRFRIKRGIWGIVGGDEADDEEEWGPGWAYMLNKVPQKL